MFKVNFYYDKNDKSDVLDWLIELSSKKSKDVRINRNKILAYIKILQEHGVSIGEPICKHLSGDIWELRPLSNRILLFYHNRDQYVLLSQFVKKTNKTPKQEIEKAENRMKDYIERHKEDK